MEQGHSILNAGAELGRFRLLKKVAVGGMAEVWSAEERISAERRRTLAVKILQPTFAGDPNFRAMFHDEVNIATILDHPNIVKVYGAHEEQGQLFQSMELLDGLDLRRMLSQLVRAGTRVPVAAALYIGEQIALALAYAHQRKSPEGKPLEIVHRDVSPHNVMLTKSGQVKLLDFGIARAAERLARTHTGIVKGKIAYMAPEQALAVGVTPQTDIFATGVVLWEMLAMQRLFRADNDADAMALVVAAQVPKIDEKNRDVAPEATSLLHKMLENRAANRPTSMAEVAAGLRKSLDKRAATEPFDFAAWAESLFDGPRSAPAVRAPDPPSDTGPLAVVGDVTEPVPAPAFAENSGESGVVDPSGRTVALEAINTTALRGAEPTPYPQASISNPSEGAPTIALQAPAIPGSESVRDGVLSSSSPSNSMPLSAPVNDTPSTSTPSNSSPSSPTPSESTPHGATPSEGSRAAGFRLPTRSEIRRAIEEQPTIPVVADPRFLAMAGQGTGARAPLPKVERIEATRTDEGALVAPSIQLDALRSRTPRQSEIETADIPLRDQPLSDSSPDGLPPVPVSISAPVTDPPIPPKKNTNLEVTLIRVSAGLAMIALALLVLFLLKAC